MNYFGQLALAFFVLSLSASGATVKYDAYYPKDMDGKIRDRFAKIIHRAYARLFATPEVLKCISKNTRIGYVDLKTVEANNGKDFFDAGKLFDEQIRVMGLHVANNDGLPPFSLKTIFDEDTFAAGYAHYGKVWTTSEKDRVYWHGGFEVTVNLAKLLEIKEEDWSSVIAHEMLHNLMHAHQDAADVGLKVAYRSEVLINTAQQCVYNPKFVGEKASSDRCGGREPK